MYRSYPKAVDAQPNLSAQIINGPHGHKKAINWETITYVCRLVSSASSPFGPYNFPAAGKPSEWGNGICPSTVVGHAASRNSRTYTRPPLNWWLKKGIFLLSNQVGSLATTNWLDLFDLIHTTYIQMYPHYMMSKSFRTSSKFMRATKVI